MRTTSDPDRRRVNPGRHRLVLPAVVALTVAACGGDGSTDTAEASSTAEVTTEQTADTAAQDSTSTSATGSESSTTAGRSIAERATPQGSDTSSKTEPSQTTSSTSTTATTSTTAAPTATTSTTLPVEGSADIESWLGTFQWAEFAAGDPGSNQTVVHELVLTGQADDGSLIGTFTQQGFQTDISLDVAAYPGETGITVFATTAGPPLYAADERLFALSGDPDAPMTTLGAVQAFLAQEVPQTGTYFTR